MRAVIRNKIAMIASAVAMLLCGSEALAPEDKPTAEAYWKEGVEAYAATEYGAAVEAFERVVEQGFGTAEVYYNLGDAYFKKGQSSEGRSFEHGELGRAILNYSRALKLNPAMEDARYNLDLARDYTNDTEALPEGFISGMWHSLRDMMTSNGWGILSVVMLVVCLALVLLYLLASRITLRKVSFFTALIALLLFVLSTALALSQRSAQLDEVRAVVVCNDTTPVHASPDSASKIVRQPSQGVILTIVRSHGEWSEVAFADGEKGWIRSNLVERI